MADSSVSVALATYNGEKYIREQLDSILDQTVPVKEIIISDDGSHDRTKEIVGHYLKTHDHMVLLDQEEHIGLNKNFQKAIEECSGSLIALSDQDNVWQKDRLEILLRHMDDKILLYSDSRMILSHGEHCQKLSETKKYIFTHGKTPKEFYFYNSAFGHNMIFRKELVKEILPFPERGTNYDGWIAFVACCVGEIGYVDQALAYYRLHEDNITHRPRSTSPDKRPKDPKWMRRRSYNHRLMEKLRVFAAVPQLDENERDFLGAFINELAALDNAYFRPRLSWMLLRHNQALLHHKKKFSGLGKSISQATGIKLYRLMGS